MGLTYPHCPTGWHLWAGLDWPLCQNGAPKLLLMAQPLKHPQSESVYGLASSLLTAAFNSMQDSSDPFTAMCIKSAVSQQE